MKDFLKTQNKNKKIKFFMDEVELTDSDKEAMVAKNKTSDLSSLLTTLQDNTNMSWVVLSTSSLLDVTDTEQKEIKLGAEDVKTYIEQVSKFRVSMLDKRVRNTSLVGVTAKQNVIEHYGSHSGSVTSAGVLKVATSNTIPGDRPTAVLCDMDHIFRRVIIGIQ